MAAKKKTSARSRAKTKVACERAGGRPVRFKGMKKGEVACFPKSKKKSTKKKSTAKRGKRKGSMAGLKKACQNAKKAGFKGKKKSLRAPCAVVLAK